MLASFGPRLNLADQTIQRFHDAVARTFDLITGRSILDGQTISATLSSGNNAITHKLGRLPVGWILVDINAAATIYRSAAFDTQRLTLNASAPCSVVLWIF